MAADPYKYFRPEAGEILEQFSRGMLDLEKGGDGPSTLQRLLRLAHTLKGAARIVKQGEIASRAHAIEDALSPLRATPEKIGREQIDSVLEHLDAIAAQLKTLSAPAAAPTAPQTPAKTETADAPRTIRTDLAEADAVLDGIAATHTLINGLRVAAQSVDQAAQVADDLVQRLGSLSSDDRNSRASAERSFSLAEDLRRKIGAIERSVDSAVDRMDREVRQLRETAERLRLVPATTLFTALERIARDAAQALGKRVSFNLTGDDIRLDTHILETLQRALVQIVRNAVAHGIESPVDRQSAGKPPVGNVSLAITRRGRQILFSCSDDGRGLDFEGVRRAASQRGLSGTGPNQPESGELVRMLLRGGISTSKTVTQESGRGIGLDVVREAVERLGGEINCRSTPGRGTTFELIIPPSLASMEALIVEGTEPGATIAIPLSSVRATRRVIPGDISLTSPGASILHDNAAVPFAPLPTVLNGATWSAARNWPTLIVGGTERAAAIGVERLLGTANIVIRPLPKEMSASPVVAAAWFDAEGNPQLVLDADRLIEAAHRGARPLDVRASKLPVLVVDDSLTTRMLEQGILESAGYDVETAMSGEEALERVQSKQFALILVDVEMPGMDGFTFIERIRADPKARDIPAILVTSLAEPAHRQRGRDVGAQGYIVKSEFDQAKLLSMIRPLVA